MNVRARMRAAARFSLAVVLCAGAGPAQCGSSSVFDQPRLRAVQAQSARTVLALFAAGEYAKAEERLRAALERMPDDIQSRYNLACALARQGKNEEAIRELESAVETGFHRVAHIRADEDLRTLRGDPRFAALLEKAARLERRRIERPNVNVAATRVGDTGIALVSETNVVWDATHGLLRVFFELDNEALAAKPVAKGLGKAGERLRTWQAVGTAAGNHGDLYDNHDGGHSVMNLAAFPQLARIKFSEAVRQRGLDRGAQLWFHYNAVVLGNSSTAITSGRAWRSQGRLMLTCSGGPDVLYRQYRGNHLYVYPEHRDHDPDGEGHGDVFPANTPYQIVSQGSSGSDKVFLNAVAAMLAAFRPDVKERLARLGMLMPTVQMVFRMSNRQVHSREDYLGGKAHPTAFEGSNLDMDRMVALAHELRADALSPLVKIGVLEEDEGVVGRDYFNVSPCERLFDTPCAIARVVRSTRYLRRMVVSAEASVDPDERPLTFHWVVLRGDADRIRIKRLGEAGAVAELLIPYHDRRPIAPGSRIESSRVDIGVFADNGVRYSAPAFVSLLYLHNQRREYDDQHRIRVVDYADPEARKNYVDPLIDIPKDWRDEYHYDATGTLTGWTRIRGEKRESFTPRGRLIIVNPNGTNETRAVRYAVQHAPRDIVRLIEQVVEPAQPARPTPPKQP